VSTILADPRTERVQQNADEAECFVCDICWSPGRPMVCGAPDEGEGDELCPDDCPHPTCPLCAEAWPAHDRLHRPWWLP
jgi:hypothetical protein